jgi:hypothetical protein
MAQVYWIHLPEHTDITTQGYIGVSTNAIQRMQTHFQLLEQNRHENIHLSRAYIKYDKFIKDILLEAEESYCYVIENHLRPNYDIGWNIAPGGDKPPPAKKGRGKGRKISEEHRQKIIKTTYFNIFNKTQERKILTSKTMKGRPKSEKQKRKQSEKMTGLLVGEKNAMFNPINRLKVSISKIGTKSLYKDGVRKMATPNSDKWNNLIKEGYTPKEIGG